MMMQLKAPTTHDRDKVIAIAEQVKANNDMFGDFSVALYAIAFEDGRQAEREDLTTIFGKMKYWLNNVAVIAAIRARSTK